MASSMSTLSQTLTLFTGETQDGAAACAGQLHQMVTTMLGPAARKPRIIFADRGPGFYHRGQGAATGDYDVARRRHGFDLWAGTFATAFSHAQHLDIADVLLHDTAISWFRSRFAKSAASMRGPGKKHQSSLPNGLLEICAT